TIQLDYDLFVASADHIAEFELSVVAGPLQTPAYTRAMLGLFFGHTDTDLDAVVAGRLARWQALYDPTKRWDLLMSESVLYLCPDAGQCTSDVVLGPRERLSAAICTQIVRIGFVPLGQPLSAWPQTSFWIFEDVVVVETAVGDATPSTGSDVGEFRAHLDKLWSVAVTDETEIRAMLDRARATARATKGGRG